jgi:hypothetical protein
MSLHLSANQYTKTVPTTARAITTTLVFEPDDARTAALMIVPYIACGEEVVSHH